MNYINKIKKLLDNELYMASNGYGGLLDDYAILVMVVGENCTQENVHDAWAVWQNKTQPNHRSIKPFKELTPDVQELGEPYRLAIIKVAKNINPR